MNCCRIAIFAFALAAAFLIMPGCNKSNTTTAAAPAKSTSTNMSAMNDMCVCGHPIGAKPVYETYNGKTIGFCCNDCKAKFDAMTPAQKNDYVAKMAAAPKAKVSMGAMNDKCPLSGGAVNKSAPTANYNGKTIGFCCGGCAAKFDAMTDAKKAETVAKMTAAAPTTAK